LASCEAKPTTDFRLAILDFKLEQKSQISNLKFKIDGLG
jgi:hypothetical protein